jgi:ethanolaminephosphotransferase
MIWKYGIEGEGEISSAMCYVIGFSFQMYLIADNCDGKQARRTGSSSPMGMLFDHGIDAVVSSTNGFMLMRMFSFAPSPYQIFIQLIAVVPFYFVTLEQYYTGEMNFPEINGVEEGSLAMMALCLASGWYGNVELWTQTIELPFLGSMQLNDILAKVVITFIYGYGATGLVNIF